MRIPEAHLESLIREQLRTSPWRLPLNLRVRVTRALSSLRSPFQDLTSSPSKAFTLAAMGLSCGLFLGVAAGGHAEGRHAAPALAEANLPAAGSLVGAVHLTGQPYELRLHHLHTGEDIDVVYRIGNTYIPSAINQLNHFLRDHRTQDVSHYDPREFDVLHSVLATLGRQNSVIDVVCHGQTIFCGRARPAQV